MDAINQAQKDGVVLGLKAVAGVAQRMDIDKLLHDLPDTFNLFCLALIDLMNDTEDSDISRFPRRRAQPTMHLPERAIYQHSYTRLRYMLTCCPSV